MDTSWRVVLPYAVFAVIVGDDGVVNGAAPIAKWMVGKRWTDCKVWIMGRGGSAEEL